MVNALRFSLLLALKIVCRVFYRYEVRWVGQVPPDPWKNHRLVAILNHTSLFEPVLAGGVPLSFMWRLAGHAVVPIAEKTYDRPLAGLPFKLLIANLIPITRKRDGTWLEVLDRLEDPDAMLIILPEGRMKRADGLDSEGKPMTVRGGIADLLRGIPEGRLLMAYSGGLHHIQAPGERWPRIFKTVRLNLEVLDIASYRQSLMPEGGKAGFKKAVVADMERRRDELGPAPDGSSPPSIG